MTAGFVPRILWSVSPLYVSRWNIMNGVELKLVVIIFVESHITRICWTTLVPLQWRSRCCLSSASCSTTSWRRRSVRRTAADWYRGWWTQEQWTRQTIPSTTSSCPVHSFTLNTLLAINITITIAGTAGICIVSPSALDSSASQAKKLSQKYNRPISL